MPSPRRQLLGGPHAGEHLNETPKPFITRRVSDPNNRNPTLNVPIATVATTTTIVVAPIHSTGSNASEHHTGASNGLDQNSHNSNQSQCQNHHHESKGNVLRSGVQLSGFRLTP